MRTVRRCRRPTRLLLSTVLLSTTLLAAAVPARAELPGALEPSGSTDYAATERQILIEFNRIRTDPADFAERLAALKRSRVDATQVKIEDGSLIDTSDYFLDAAIAAAKKQQPMPPMQWSDAVARAAQQGADQDRDDHQGWAERLRRAGTYDRIDEVNRSVRSVSALAFAYLSYISPGQSAPGHRGIVIDADQTQLGAGCATSPTRDARGEIVLDPTTKKPEPAWMRCVVDTARNWVSTPGVRAPTAPTLATVALPINGHVGTDPLEGRLELSVDTAAPAGPAPTATSTAAGSRIAPPMVTAPSPTPAPTTPTPGPSTPPPGTPTPIIPESGNRG